jgi:hypothetical protein
MSFAMLVSSLKIIGDMWIGKLITRQDNWIRPHENEKLNSALSMNPLWYFFAPVKDLVIGFIWFVPLISNTVEWRGNRYIIGKDSLLSPCPESGFWSWRYRLLDAVKTRLA